MKGIFLPELLIYKQLSSIITSLRNDLIDNESDESESILYKLLGEDEEGEDIKLENYNFYKQSKKIFLNKNYLIVYFGYNLKTTSNLSLHILLPSENESDNMLGDDFGGEIEDWEFKLSNFFDSTYQIMIRGDNSSEISILYNVLKSMFLIIREDMELLGFNNLKVSGNDIVMQDDFAPVPLFQRVINLSFKYNLSVPSGIKNVLMEKIKATGHPY